MSLRNRWILVWAAAILPLLGWWTSGLFDLDEGFYAAVVAEMNRRGEWITPYYNGSPWFEKPVLLYWLAKPTLALFGEAVGPRLPSVLSNIGIYLLVAWFCRRRLSDSVAQLAVLIVASSLLVVIYGRQMMIDSGLSLCMLAGWLTFWESLDGDKRWRWVSGLAVGVGVLAKGPVALILLFLVIGWMYMLHPGLRPSFRSGWLGFWVAFVAAICTWYLPAYLVNGQTFVQEFLIEQNIGRFLGGDAAHTIGGIESLLFYFVVFLVGMIPWSLWAPKALLKRKDQGMLGSYLATCGVAIFVFFLVSGAKLPHYILPCFAPIAILLAARLESRKWFFGFGVAWCVVLAILVNVLQPWYYQASGQAEAHKLARYIRRHVGDYEVALFQLGRREKDLGTGTLKLKESSLPSMMLYLDRATLDTDDYEKILQVEKPVWLFTRKGRIQPEHYARALQSNKFLERVHTAGIESKSYELFRVRGNQR